MKNRRYKRSVALFLASRLFGEVKASSWSVVSTAVHVRLSVCVFLLLKWNVPVVFPQPKVESLLSPLDGILKGCLQK